VRSSSNGPVILSEDRCGGRVEGSAVASDKTGRRTVSAFVKGLQFAEAAVLAVAICFSLGASDASSRFNDLGHRLMCTCSCAQLLGECNHVGCPESGRMRDELSAAIASGLSDKQILDGFAAKYGATVLAAPTTKGFDLVAWIAPFAVFAAALLGTILLIRHWGGLGSKPQTAVAATAPADPAEQERLERIRRETGGEGGF
jgi:cytochrome c-type biogenesis protein CcmH/NrfF